MFIVQCVINIYFNTDNNVDNAVDIKNELYAELYGALDLSSKRHVTRQRVIVNIEEYTFICDVIPPKQTNCYLNRITRQKCNYNLDCLLQYRPISQTVFMLSIAINRAEHVCATVIIKHNYMLMCNHKIVINIMLCLLNSTGHNISRDLQSTSRPMTTREINLYSIHQGQAVGTVPDIDVTFAYIIFRLKGFPVSDFKHDDG